MTENRSIDASPTRLVDREPRLQRHRVTTALLLVFVISAASTYYFVTIDKLNVFTGMLFLSMLSSFVWLFTETLLNLLNVSRDARNNIRLSLLTTIVLLFAMELFLRFGLGTYSNYLEQNGSGDYVSPYSQNTQSWFHTYYPNSTFNLLRPEFSHSRKINSLGIPEREIQRKKAADEYRIVALGDSYTDGIGTSYESTWIKVFENALNRRVSNKKLTTINAGVSGSDVYFEYMLLREKLLSYHPDLVIVAVNANDIEDIITRGGMDRFASDGTLRTRKGPKWEWVYGVNYIFRHIIHDAFKLDWLFLAPGEVAREEQAAADKMKLALEHFARLEQNYNFKLVVVFHPLEGEIANGHYYPPPYKNLIQEFKRSSRTHIIDLLDYYQSQQIITKGNTSELFWPIDRHHNTKGYAVMGQAIADNISRSPFFERDVGLNPVKNPLTRKISNPSDEDRENKWRMQVSPGNVAYLVFPRETQDVVRIAITKAATAHPWHIQLNQDQISVKVRQRYVLTFRAKADRVRNIAAAVSLQHEPWFLGLYKTIGLTQEWQTFELEFNATENDDNARIHFDVGGNAASVELSGVALRTVP